MISFEQLLPGHWPQVKAIYLEGIKTGNATFETSAPEWEEWNKAHVESCRLVAKVNDEVAAWAALTAVSGRCVYAGVGEVSVYVAEKFRGQGIGKQLLKKLIEASEENPQDAAHNFWTLQAGIFPENISSIKIHESLGFKIIGKHERIGKMHGVWRDTLLLERRSEKVGVD